MNKAQNVNASNFIQTLWKDIWEINVAMLVTQSNNGLLRSRPMMTQAIEEPNFIWFADRVESTLNTEIIQNTGVNLSYSDRSKGIYISLSGKAQIVTDQENLEQVVTKTASQWIPDTVKDPHLSAIRVEVVTAEYWCTDKGLLHSLTDYLSVFSTSDTTTHERPEHERIQLQALS